MNYGRAATAYDPFSRVEDAEAREKEGQLLEAQREHQLWSLEQARAGKSALARTGDATWVIPPNMTIGKTTDTKDAAPRG